MQETQETTSTEDAAPSALPPSVAHVARRAERRLRAARALAWLSRAAAVGLVLALVVVVLRKTGLVSEAAARVSLLGLVVGSLSVAVVAFARRLPESAGAIALDRHHGLHGRLASALAFASLPAPERTPFMDAAVEDASAHARGVDPRAAVPMKRPRELPFVLGMAATIALVSAFELRTHVPAARAKTIDAVDVTDDDLDAMREFLREVDQRLETDEAKAALQEFNQLVEDLAQRRLDRTEAFRRMQALEDRLLEGNAADKKAFEEQLARMGEELKKSELSKPAGEALADKNLSAAEKAFKELAKKLREQGKSVDKQELEKLRAALAKSAEEAKKRAEAIDKRRDELKEQLLKQKQKASDAGPNDEEKSLLQKRERELERLDREREQHERTGRQLDRLDRELQKSAEDLMKDLGLSADDLDSAAEDINRMARQEMTQDEKEQLRKKLEELRQTLRQQAQGGQGQMKRLRQFQQRAQGRGQQGQRGQPGEGQDGEGQDGEQGQGQQGQEGQGQQGQGQQAQGQGRPGQGQQGQGQGQQGQGQGGGRGAGQGGETWILGPNGEKLLMLSKGRGQGAGQGQGQGQGGQGEGQGGHGAGSGHDDDVQGKQATNLGAGTQDTQVAGTDTGQGGSRPQVILGAAERGFASRGYQRVFREYHTVAEEALERDEIPGGYRFYVRRYFQLIRPREDAAEKGTDKP